MLYIEIFFILIILPQKAVRTEVEIDRSLKVVKLNDRMTFNGAQCICQSLGGHLPSIHNKRENNEILSHYLHAPHQWLGAKATKNDGSGTHNFAWVDSTPWDFENWSTKHGEPNNGNGKEFCVTTTYLRAHRTFWNDVRCDLLLPFVCLVPLDIESIINEPIVPIHNNSKSVVPFDEKMTFKGAECMCKSIGGHLPSIHSEQENKEILQPLRHKPHQWLGAKATKNDGLGNHNFEWLDGTPWDYKNWCKPHNEPNNGNGKEFCITTTYRRQFRDQWNDIRCNRLFSFVCLVSEPQDSTITASNIPKAVSTLSTTTMTTIETTLTTNTLMSTTTATTIPIDDTTVVTIPINTKITALPAAVRNMPNTTEAVPNMPIFNSSTVMPNTPIDNTTVTVPIKPIADVPSGVINASSTALSMAGNDSSTTAAPTTSIDIATTMPINISTTTPIDISTTTPIDIATTMPIDITASVQTTPVSNTTTSMFDIQQTVQTMLRTTIASIVTNTTSDEFLSMTIQRISDNSTVN